MNEQDLAKIRDSLPHTCWAVYTGGREAGFTDDQAFALAMGFLVGGIAKSVTVITSPLPPEKKED